MDFTAHFASSFPGFLPHGFEQLSRSHLLLHRVKLEHYPLDNTKCFFFIFNSMFLINELLGPSFKLNYVIISDIPIEFQMISH